MEPRYSGPNRSGICICGHSWREHHLGVVLNTDYVDAIGEAYIPQECEYYGFDEMGGLDTKGQPHCMSYKDKKGP